ncbi:MAG: hypothetical protein IJ880_12435 [Bacilli bacterium]|nr:hypothetical protein [Bacilli bacterium]
MNNINEVMDLMRKIDRQDSVAMTESISKDAKQLASDTKERVRGSINRMANTVKDTKDKVTKFPYVPFIKKALHKNFTNVAKKLRFNESTVNVGYNFIESVIEYKKLKNPDELNRFAYNRNVGLEESVVESTFTGLIESYGKKLRILNSQMNSVEGYNEDYFSANNTKLMNEFESDVEHSTPDKLNEKIANRVENATKDFIEKRNEEQDRIKSIYNAAQNIQGDENQSQEMKDAAAEAVKINLTDLRNKPVPLFEAMVVGVSTMAVKDEEYKKLYLNENGSINIGRIIDDVSAIYAVMEECNVTGLIKIDKDFLHDFISSLK